MSEKKTEKKFEKQFVDNGGYYSFRLQATNELPLDHLPGAVYEIVIETSPLTGISIKYNKVAATFKVPEKRFGKHNIHLERIKADYDRHNPSMGVLLQGLKGSGKSMFAEDLGNWAIGQGLPVVMVTQAIGQDLLRYILTAVGPCILYFDEFGKTYSSEDRAKLLSLFSDSTLTGVLFVITGNEKSEFTDAIYDRPGRFRYRLEFGDLKTDAAEEVGNYYHLTEDLKVGLARYVSTHSVSYDMLCTLCTMVRGLESDEAVAEHLSILNIPRWGRAEPTVSALSIGGVEQRIRTGSFEWDGKTLTAQVRPKAAIADALMVPEWKTVSLPLRETLDYYRKHEKKSGDQTTVTDDVELTYQFRITNKFDRALKITVADNLLVKETADYEVEA